MDQIPGPEQHWRGALAEGRFLLQRETASGAHIFPPRVTENSEWVAASGLGTVYSRTTVRQRPPAVSHDVVLIDLDEGPRLMSAMRSAEIAAPAIGARVRLVIDQTDAGPLLVCEPLHSAI